MQPPALAETKKEKKKQKRKREEDASTPSDPGASREKDKDRKKRRKDRSSDPSSSSTPAQHTSAEATPAPSSSETSAYLEKHAIKIHSPGHIGPITPALSFDQLDIPPGLRSAFSTFKEPTPIQTCTWPPALKGHDVVGIAETGSGKTLAFGIPALAQLISSAPSKSKSKSSSANLSVSVLVLAPTRELAIQTHDTLSDLGGKFNIASVALFGGVEKGGQIRTLQNANKDGKTTRIVVGTPGRILDLVNDGICDLSGVSYLVLDEADRMLDKGFENDIRSIISHTKQGEDRQTLMFSATWPEAVRRLASTFQRDPVRVTVGSDDLTANSRVEQVVEVFDDARSKDNRLIAQLRNNKTKADLEESRTLIFALYKKEASRVENMLRGKGYSVGALHGDMSQAARMDALQSFKDGRTRFLVATDVAARGLDIPNVGLVINYTFPLTIEDYIHRIGRTGRGGRSGKSVTFFTGDNHERALAGELARVLHESGFEAEGLKKFPMTIKKKTHSAYGAFFRDDIPAPAAPTKIKF
ncbi:hypothetical protein JAAARDRAFT_134554 [Jaapia argillacea MUCL 33604]|uniref:RNA helicase n=1 Tax=Jaapia argillacea MUCL 33604 TaxID=933084 RepID=A0A067PME4_9AGAM|nr:hypothetical protein JAAARDRAFT_134554 [Jaapia argillacea MUCL 33604]